MDVKKLTDYFTGSIRAADFKASIASEVAQFKSKQSVKGATVPIYVENDTVKFTVKHDHIKRLCEDYLTGVIDEWDLNYIADVLDIARASDGNIQADDEDIQSMLFILSNPSINYPIGSRLIRVIKNWLEGKSSEKFGDYLKTRMDNRELKKQYKNDFKELRDIINEWDPYSLIAEGAPVDEFEAEVGEVLAGLPKCKNENDVIRLISQIFSRAFEAEYFTPSHCEVVGKKVFGLKTVKDKK